MSLIPALALLIFLTLHKGVCVGDLLGDRCLCIHMERKPIGRHIAMVEVKPANSQCAEIQIIATLKKNGMRICLDPRAPWVRRVLEKAKAEPTP